MIDTLTYGFHKPQDSDLADLEVFVGQNMDLIETALINLSSDLGVLNTSFANHSHSWNQITGKPSTFAPSTHNHTWTEITGKPTTFAPTTHTHAWVDITNKPTTFAPSTHNHDWGEITNKPVTFPSVAHFHTISDVTGLQNALDSKISTLPHASVSTLGAVKIGNGLQINEGGYIFQKIGKGLKFDPAFAVEIDVDSLSLPTASALSKGLIQVGSGLAMSGEYLYVKTGDGLEVDFNTNELRLTQLVRDSIDSIRYPKIASGLEAGVVRVGDGLAMSGEYLYVKISNDFWVDSGTNEIHLADDLIVKSLQVNGASQLLGKVTLNESLNANWFNVINVYDLDVKNKITVANGIVNENRINANLVNGWVHYSGVTGIYTPVSYWKDKNGVVHLQGLMKGGTTGNGTWIFVLPVGYRPNQSEIFIQHTGTNSYCRIDIDAGGIVKCMGGQTSEWISFAGIHFKGEK